MARSWFERTISGHPFRFAALLILTIAPLDAVLAALFHLSLVVAVSGGVVSGGLSVVFGAITQTRWAADQETRRRGPLG